MKKIRLFTMLSAFALAAAGALGLANLKESKEVEQVKAEAEVTVYCAILPSELGSHSLRINAKVGDNKPWQTVGMSNTGKTYENRMIFVGTFTEYYGGVNVLQFQLVNGGNVDGQNQPYGDWTTRDVFENKMYVYNTGWTNYAETSVFLANSSGVAGDELDYNDENAQYEGVITTTVDNYTFKLKKVTGESVSYPAALDSGVSSSVATSDGSLITIKKAGAYMVYYKSDTTIWMQDAEPYLVAYAYAGYFLTNVGCDADGVNAPSGWSTVATRYAGLSDAVKNYIYSFDVADARAKDAGDDIVAMIDRYEWAINHNPNSLSHFIKNAAGTERPISSSRNISPLSMNNETSRIIPIIVIISLVSVTAVGGYFFIKRRQTN